MPMPTYAGTIDHYRWQYSQHLATRQISPFIVPVDISGYLLLIASLTLRSRAPTAPKSLTFLAIVILSVRSMEISRTLGLAYGILVGISSAWCVALSGDLLFLREPAKFCKRKVACSHLSTQNECSQNGVNNVTRWQRMPLSSHQRLFWILDLLGSPRALHWSHGGIRYSNLTSAVKTYRENISSFKRNVGKLLFIYLCIDCLKELIAADPYFWGYVDHDPPDYIRLYLPGASLVQAYRMLVAFAVLYISIELISTVGVLLLVNILGPSLAGTWGEDWAYFPQYGDLDAVFTRGLRGWWGSWWHQMFRPILISPANALVDRLEIPRRGFIARGIRLIIPFAISGAIHAAGSYTMWGATRPIDSFLFFVLQPVGIAIQILGSLCLTRLNLGKNIPMDVRKAANVLFAVIWLLKTFPLLCDDFARGGLWLTEPFPVSVLQMLGIGSAARSGQLGFKYGVHPHSGGTWWQIGLAT